VSECVCVCACLCVCVCVSVCVCGGSMVIAGSPRFAFTLKWTHLVEQQRGHNHSRFRTNDVEPLRHNELLCGKRRQGPCVRGTRGCGKVRQVKNDRHLAIAKLAKPLVAARAQRAKFPSEWNELRLEARGEPVGVNWEQGDIKSQ
jgi:hypothetical protein